MSGRRELFDPKRSRAKASASMCISQARIQARVNLAQIAEIRSRATHFKIKPAVNNDSMVDDAL